MIHNKKRLVRFLIGFIGLGVLAGMSMFLTAPVAVQVTLSGGAVACALIAMSGLTVVEKAATLVGAWRKK